MAEFDIRDFLSELGQDQILALVEQRVSDQRVITLIRRRLRADTMVDGVRHETVSGTPQGGMISPFLANIVLHEIDRRWDEHHDGILVR